MAAKNLWELELDATAAALARGCEICGKAAHAVIARREHVQEYAPNSRHYLVLLHQV